MAEEQGNFLNRWSRRKALAREGVVLPTAAAPLRPPVPAEVPPAATDAAAPELPAAPAPPAPTLADVAELSAQSDYTPFVARGVVPEVKNAALRKLFSDPHFNVMDGLDTYIDDYGKPDPLPAGMLRKMAQAHVLGLFDDDPPAAGLPAAAPATPTALPPPDNDCHEDPDLQLQPDDAAGCSRAAQGLEPDAGRQH